MKIVSNICKEITAIMESTKQINIVDILTEKVPMIATKKGSYSKEALIGIIFSICICALIFSWRSDGLFLKELLISKAIVGMALVLKLAEK